MTEYYIAITLNQGAERVKLFENSRGSLQRKNFYVRSMNASYINRTFYYVQNDEVVFTPQIIQCKYGQVYKELSTEYNTVDSKILWDVMIEKLTISCKNINFLMIVLDQI